MIESETTQTADDADRQRRLAKLVRILLDASKKQAERDRLTRQSEDAGDDDGGA
jgi:hypothetical protein